jgi:hypothetical protein
MDALPDGRVRQHFQESADDGKTWQEWFDGYYRRSRSRSGRTSPHTGARISRGDAEPVAPPIVS